MCRRPQRHCNWVWLGTRHCRTNWLTDKSMFIEVLLFQIPKPLLPALIRLFRLRIVQLWGKKMQITNYWNFASKCCFGCSDQYLYELVKKQLYIESVDPLLRVINILSSTGWCLDCLETIRSMSVTLWSTIRGAEIQISQSIFSSIENLRIYWPTRGIGLRGRIGSLIEV